MAGDGAVYIPSLIVEGYGGEIGGDIDVPKLRIDAEGRVELSSALLDIPPLSVESTGLVGIVSVGTIEIPGLQIDGYGYNFTAQGEIFIPPLRVDATGLNGIVGTVSIDIPMFQLDAAPRLNPFGTASITIPKFIINAYGRLVSHQNFKAMCVNINHHAVTEYGDFRFNSLAAFGGKVLMANSSGLYSLGGDTDNGSRIDSLVIMGLSDIHKDNIRYAREAWIVHKGEGTISLVVRVDEDTQYEYEAVQPNNASERHLGLRAKVGRGIRSRFVEFGLKNIAGRKFEVSSIRVYGEVSGRRTR